MLLAAAAAVAMFAATGPALAAQGFIVTYYYDAGHTQVAGYAAMDCTGHVYFYGTETGFTVTQVYQC
jgi:hypothetical protein